MNRMIACAIALWGLLLTGIPRPDIGFAGPGRQDLPAPAAGYREDELLVKFRTGTAEQEKKNVHDRHGSKRSKEFPFLRLHLVKLAEGVGAEKALSLYRADPAVEYAEPNFIVRLEDVAPNDPYFGELWGLYNTGQAGGVPGADIDAPAAWSLATGDGSLVVAVIDTGLDYSHEDILANRW